MSLIKEATSRHRKELFRLLVSRGKIPERYGYGPPKYVSIMAYEGVGTARREGKILDEFARHSDPAYHRALKLRRKIELNRQRLNSAAASTPSGKPFLSRRNLAIGSAAAGLTALGTAAYLRNRKRKQEEQKGLAYS